ncbi:multidrug resistance protein [Haloferula luteola]|uniref:Multidrug resistance protein n=1 Tax=Haloferula luteola TaxID=595692 RepID=A0A840V115_9BACT|nr:MFS transporter [Haloferula luteola]MBB5351685.1 multidrug resistance protein [Haloferula luteola]
MALSSASPVSERSLLPLLAAVQFTHIMDFMVVMPLGPQLMRELDISAAAFGHIISAFALTSGVVGLAMAPFADRFDRRKLLLVCYAGFVLGSLACGMSKTAEMLMVARALCGAFGGVSSATLLTIVADVVPPERRARGMGIIMTAFSAAAALGVPLGLKLAQWWKWEAPFLVIAVLAAGVWVLLAKVLPPVRAHLDRSGANPGRDFLVLLKDGNAWTGIGLMMACVMGHFMIIPYLSPYLVGNVGVSEDHLFLVYLVGGVVTIFTGPFVGKMADRHGRFRIFCVLVVFACGIVFHIANSGPLPLWHVLVNAAFFFVFASGRFVPAQATISLAVPSERRGAYMSLVSCSRDLASGTTAAIGAMVVSKGAGGALNHFDRLGWMAIAISLCSLWVFRQVRMAE